MLVSFLIFFILEEFCGDARIPTSFNLLISFKYNCPADNRHSSFCDNSSRADGGSNSTKDFKTLSLKFPGRLDFGQLDTSSSFWTDTCERRGDLSRVQDQMELPSNEDSSSVFLTPKKKPKILFEELEDEEGESKENAHVALPTKTAPIKETKPSPPKASKSKVVKPRKPKVAPKVQLKNQPSILGYFNPKSS
ncbi:unnamed protein product [Rodentolepis nana]|uniref:DNA ligase 1-like n=1 Tax=Rodentolepis nana TaxID=102285 RepID=A0A0R3T1Y2_RODNA|nr:unnamed protein product [Rodentolepis nana]